MALRPKSATKAHQVNFRLHDPAWTLLRAAVLKNRTTQGQIIEQALEAWRSTLPSAERRALDQLTAALAPPAHPTDR